MFIPDENKKTVRIPAKIINGKAEYYYDSNLKLKEGAFVDMIVRKIDVVGDIFQKELDDNQTCFLLPKDTLLMAQIEPSGIGEDKEIDETIKRAIRILVDSGGDPRALENKRLALFEIILMEDLYIRLRGGNKKATLKPCPCAVPILKKTALSVNHAYSLLSHDFERNRTSHVGNVFNKILYRNRNAWIPLDVLRTKMQSEKEQKYIRS